MLEMIVLNNISKQIMTIAPCSYKSGEVLGAGTYAVVKKAIKIDTGELFAFKVINKKMMEGREDMIRNEINVLKKASMGHKNIVRLVDYFETMNNLYLGQFFSKSYF